MALHLKFMLSVIVKPVHVIKARVRDDRAKHSKLLDADGNFKQKNDEGIITHVIDEFDILQGNARTFHRVFVKTRDSGHYDAVGWIAWELVDHCMICYRQLKEGSMKTNCRACGNIICSSCCSDHAEVLELASVGPVIVCRQCDYGQV
jgi:hypothetical protein